MQTTKLSSTPTTTTAELTVNGATVKLESGTAFNGDEYMGRTRRCRINGGEVGYCYMVMDARLAFFSIVPFVPPE